MDWIRQIMKIISTYFQDRGTKRYIDRIKAMQKNKETDRIEKANKLYSILSQVVKLKQYKKRKPKNNPDGRYTTYCNVLARDVLDSRCKKVWIMGWLIGGENGIIKDGYDYDIGCLNPDRSLESVLLSTTVQLAYKNAIEASKIGIVESISMKEAQERANKGIPIWVSSAKYNHEAIVCPDLKNIYNEKKGCLIAQAGFYNGIFYISDKKAWGNRFQDTEIKYYEFNTR
jgi:hypothetical protein